MSRGAPPRRRSRAAALVLAPSFTQCLLVSLAGIIYAWPRPVASAAAVASSTGAPCGWRGCGGCARRAAPRGGIRHGVWPTWQSGRGVWLRGADELCRLGRDREWPPAVTRRPLGSPAWAATAGIRRVGGRCRFPPSGWSHPRRSCGGGRRSPPGSAAGRWGGRRWALPQGCLSAGRRCRGAWSVAQDPADSSGGSESGGDDSGDPGFPSSGDTVSNYLGVIFDWISSIPQSRSRVQGWAACEGTCEGMFVSVRFRSSECRGRILVQIGLRPAGPRGVRVITVEEFMVN